jgi:rhodanese-related sulfurtransferase
LPGKEKCLVKKELIMDDFSEPKVPQVTCEDVKKAIDDKENFTLLDVRTEGEFARGKIVGSINLPVDKVDLDISKVVPDKSAKVYVYCLSGSRSMHAVDVMRKLGYTNIYSMEYGLLGWRAKYFPTSP